MAMPTDYIVLPDGSKAPFNFGQVICPMCDKTHSIGIRENLAETSVPCIECWDKRESTIEWGKPRSAKPWSEKT